MKLNKTKKRRFDAINISRIDVNCSDKIDVSKSSKFRCKADGIIDDQVSSKICIQELSTSAHSADCKKLPGSSDHHSVGSVPQRHHRACKQQLVSDYSKLAVNRSEHIRFETVKTKHRSNARQSRTQKTADVCNKISKCEECEDRLSAVVQMKPVAGKQNEMTFSSQRRKAKNAVSETACHRIGSRCSNVKKLCTATEDKTIMKKQSQLNKGIPAQITTSLSGQVRTNIFEEAVKQLNAVRNGISMWQARKPSCSRSKIPVSQPPLLSTSLLKRFVNIYCCWQFSVCTFVLSFIIHFYATAHCKLKKHQIFS